MLASPETYCFGRFRLEPARRALLCDGKQVPITARAFDMLELLVRNRDRVVTREEIVAGVWQGLAVGENNLTVQMSTLRRTLADCGADQLIITLPNRGYQFVGELIAPSAAHQSFDVAAAAAPEQPSKPHGRPGRTIMAAFAVVALLILAACIVMWRSTAPSAPRLSIAVLPFRNLNDDPAQDYLADAISDDLTTDLSHIPGSVVIARESADTYKSKTVALTQIGRELHVRYLIGGSVLAEDGEYHINAQLTDAETGVQIWAGQFDKQQGRLREARDAIVRKLASALDFKLAEVESARSQRDRPLDPDALDLFLQARFIAKSDESLKGMESAQRLLEQSLLKAPEFVEANLELGWLLLRKLHGTDDPDDIADFQRAQVVIATGMRLAPHNAEALAGEGRLLMLEGSCVDAEYKANEALQVEPSSVKAHMVLGTCGQMRGNMQEAEPHLQAMLRLDPENPLNTSTFMALGYNDLVQGRVADASDMLHRAIGPDAVETDGADSLGRAEYVRLLLIAAYQMSGDKAAANRKYEQYRSIWPHRTAWRVGAYFAKPLSNLSGQRRIIEALVEAGMPRAADEHEGSTAGAAACGPGDFAPTPASLRDGETVHTAELAFSLRSPNPPMLIDVSRGTASPPGAVWMNPNSGVEAGAFARQAVRSRPGINHDSRIVVIGDGPYGCAAYDAARDLIAAGYVHAAWYRGGEEAWSAANQPAIDQRP